MSLVSNLVDVVEFNQSAGSNEVADKSKGVLTQVSSPGSGAGVTGTARTFSAGSRFTKASSSAYQVGDYDFMFFVRVKLNALTGFPCMFAKEDAGGGACEYHCSYDTTANRFQFRVAHDGSTLKTVVANNYGGVVTGKWYNIFGWHDSVNNVIGIRVVSDVGDATDTLAHTLGCFTSTNSSSWGARVSGGIPLDGSIDQWAMWKEVLSTSEQNQLLNSLSGLAYLLWSPAKNITDDDMWCSLHWSTQTYKSWTLYELGNPATDPPSLFNPTRYDHFESWMDEAKKMGASGAAMTAHHVDAFCMFNSSISTHSIRNATCPFSVRNIDILGDFARMARIYGFKVGVYYCMQDQYYEQHLTGTYTYPQWSTLMLTDLMSNYGALHFIEIDVWGDNFWGPNGGISYTTVPYQPIEDLIASLQPNCAFNVNDHVHAAVFQPGTVDTWERTFEGLPAQVADSGYLATFGWDTLHKNYTGDNTARWFYHADTEADTAAESKPHIINRYTMLKNGFTDFANFSPAPDGRVAAGTKALIAEMWVPVRTPVYTSNFAAGGVPTNLQTYDSHWIQSGFSNAVINPTNQVWTNGIATYFNDTTSYADNRVELIFNLLTSVTNGAVGVSCGPDATINIASGVASLVLSDNGNPVDTVAVGETIAVGVNYKVVTQKIGSQIRAEIWKQVSGRYLLMTKAFASTVLLNSNPIQLSLIDSASSITGIHITSIIAYIPSSTPPSRPSLSVLNSTTLTITNGSTYTKIYRYDNGEWIICGFTSAATFVDTEVANVNTKLYFARNINNEWIQSADSDVLGKVPRHRGNGILGLGLGSL